MSQLQVQRASMTNKSVMDLEDDIDHDVEALELELLTAQKTNVNMYGEDTDFVNLDQLGNTIAASKSEDRKFSIDDILNQTSKHPQALECIDQCIKIVIDTWNIQQLKKKRHTDLYRLLKDKYADIWKNIITYFYDKPSFICAKIIQIAKRISAMKLILDRQKLVHLPNTPTEWATLLTRLKQKGQSLAATQRSQILTAPEINEEPNTELKSDETYSNDDMQMFGNAAIDDTVNGVTANDALQDILLRHRTLFIKTNIYKQMTDRSHNRGGSIMKSILKGSIMKSKSPGNTSTSISAADNHDHDAFTVASVNIPKISEDKVLPNENNAVEMKLLNGSDSENENENDARTDTHIKKVDMSKQYSASNRSNRSESDIVFTSDAVRQSLSKNWKNPKCAGCGHTIHVSFDSKNRATKSVITYDCKFVEDLEDTWSSLVYFHDKHCENLRKYKESIRKYVLESQLPHSSKRRVNSMSNYVKNLLNHKDLLINIDSGELTRPSKILRKEQDRFLNFITAAGGLFKQKEHAQQQEMKVSIDMDKLDKKEEERLSLLDISKQRDIAVRLLTRGEIIGQTFKKANIKLFHHFVEELDEDASVAVNDNDDNDIEEEPHGIFDDIPKTIQYADSHIFGEPLFKFVVQQLLSKQTTALWRLLAYISMQLPTVHSISLLNEHQSDLAKAKKMEHLELVCTSIIQAAAYPIGTALHLSGFMSDLAENDLSREDDFREVATRYINIAENLVEYIESDHLLALLLEVPTDIDQMNVFDIAIQFSLDDFFDNNRVDRVITHMHQQFDFLNPNKTFSTQEMSTHGLVKYMIQSPSKFYYSPIGKWWTASILYILYVFCVTSVCAQQNYLYTPITTTEWVMWVANAGYITYEITEMLLAGFEYFSETSNLFDTCISINWVILAGLRLLAPLIFPNNLIYGNGNKETKARELQARNKYANVIYMFLFGVQMCLLYLRFATILSRSRKLGPFVRMIITMISDILNFGLIVLLLMTGFTYAISFIIGPDKDPNTDSCYDDQKDHSKVPLSTIPSVAAYVFQTLLGQQEWPDIQSNDCLSSNRSRVVQLYIMVFSVLGTVLMLNLLIAMMASTYENKRQSTSKDVNFSRTEETYSLAHRNALISAPFNIVAYAISLFFELITIIVIICTGGRYVFDIFSLVPVWINYQKTIAKDKQIKKNKIQKNCGRMAKCCCTFIRSVEELASENDINKGLYIRNVYFNYGDGGRRFCRYCRTYIKKAGDISDYFELFIHYRLDEDDVQLMKRIMHNTGLCPTCYRPYKIYNDGTTDRLQRWEIQIEVISYYVFRIFVHIPMILLLLLPALFGGFGSWISNIAKDSHKITTDGENELQRVSTDEHYRNLVQNVINNELQQDMDLLSTQIDLLDKKFTIISNQQKNYNSQLNNITNLLTKIYDKQNNNNGKEDEHDVKKQKIQQKQKVLGGLLNVHQVSTDSYHD